MRQRPTLSDADKSQKNLTVKDVEKLLAAAGFPRDERSIERYCKQGSLDGEKHPDDLKYYISLASVEKLIKNFQDAQSRRAFGPFADSGPAVSDGIRHATTPPRQERDEPTAPPPADAGKIKELEDKLFNLEVDKRATEKVNNILREQIKDDREQYFKQIQTFAQELSDSKQLVGELQTQLKQIAAPKSGATPGMRQITEADIIDDTSQTSGTDTSPTASPSAHATFADIREPHSGNLV
jgi:hypothetical protein